MDTKQINREYLLSLIEKVEYERKGNTTTCILHVNNMTVEGESHCMMKAQYIKQVGEKVSYENALKSLRQFEQYHQNKTVNGE